MDVTSCGRNTHCYWSSRPNITPFVIIHCCYFLSRHNDRIFLIVHSVFSSNSISVCFIATCNVMRRVMATVACTASYRCTMIILDKVSSTLAKLKLIYLISDNHCSLIHFVNHSFFSVAQGGIIRKVWMSWIMHNGLNILGCEISTNSSLAQFISGKRIDAHADSKLANPIWLRIKQHPDKWRKVPIC